MAFSNIGSAEQAFGSTNSASDTISVAVPNLATNSIGFVFATLTSTTATVTGVTWNGQAMSAGPAPDAGVNLVACFYLVNPPDNGTYNIVASYSSTNLHHGYIAVGWADAGAAVSIDDTSSTTGTTQNPSITSTQAGANELVVSCSNSNANNVGAPTTTNCTELTNHDHGGDCVISAYSIPTSSGDATHTHNYSQSGTYAIASMSFKEATTARRVFIVQ